MAQPRTILAPSRLEDEEQVDAILEAERIEAYRDYLEEHLNYRELTTDSEVRQLVEVLKEHQIKQLTIDFETAKGKNDLHGVTEGRLRLIQVGIDDPRFKRRQWIIDCDQADPRPLNKLFADWNIEKIIHWSPFEQEWAQTHLGSSIGNVYDTAFAFQSINKELERWQDDPEKRDKIKDIILDWEKKHRVKLDVLCDRYLGISLPKENQDSDWGQKELSEDQKVYAAVDVIAPFDLAPIAKDLAEKLKITGRIKWRCGNARKEAAQVTADNKFRSRDLAWELVYAKDITELKQIWNQGRALHTGIGFSERQQIEEFYQERLQELS
jgi:ribonuclease D